jgi:hypothetical protein
MVMYLQWLGSIIQEQIPGLTRGALSDILGFCNPEFLKSALDIEKTKFIFHYEFEPVHITKNRV